MESLVITGGSGLLGRALIERLYGKVRLTAISRSEKAQLPLRRRWPEVRWILGDVQDGESLFRACDGADTLIHAAALKHVDISESEPTNYTQVNVIGSLVVASFASVLGMRAVGISTDKASDPRNVYGLTKLLMERVFCEQGHVCVRYGNVFGSDGSVLDVWRRQLAETGSIRVTDPEMTRFFFPIETAVEEVLWAMEYCPAGYTSVPSLRAARLMDLAIAFVQSETGNRSPRVSTEAPADIVVTGPRPGEKRHECLLSEHESERCRALDGRSVLHPTEQSGQPVSPLRSDAVERIPVAEIRDWLGTLEAAA